MKLLYVPSFLILSFLAGCSTQGIESNFLTFSVESNSSDNPYINRSPTIESQKKNSEYLQNHIFAFNQHQNGPYVINNDDLWLVNNYTKLFSYREVFLNRQKSKSLTLPYYEPLKITRTGKTTSSKKWKINIHENNLGEFIIKGTNSHGLDILNTCSLKECLQLI